MVTLEKEFVSGDGGFSTDPLTYKQVKRTETVAIYERSRDGQVKDYEVFIIRVDPKGKVQKFPNGSVKVLEDDIEKYPSSGVFGFTAWSIGSLKGAEYRFDELVAKGVAAAAEEENPTPEKAIIMPVGEFSTKELATANGIDYLAASLFIKAGLGDGTIKFVREERRNVKGKATKLYIKA